MMLRGYLYQLLRKYVSMLARPGDKLLVLDEPGGGFGDTQPNVSRAALMDLPEREFDADYVLLNGTLHYERDIQDYLARLRAKMASGTRLIAVYYSGLWRPVLALATNLGLRQKTPEWNWLANEDMENLMHLADFEVVRREQKILIPIYIPILSAVVNRYIAPLPIVRTLALLNILVARPKEIRGPHSAEWSVSVVVPARNEAGNIEAIVKRVPKMGPNDEVIFIEGGSSDGTWQRIEDVEARFGSVVRLQIAQQEGKGKGDAVRKGFALARNEVLMILDADLTVAPEDLPKFYEAISSGKGEFINGSRLVYPMERRAMRFLNLLANKFFAVAFSFVLAQRFKDTLCGTKVITRENYTRLASNRGYFGDFDPFGDFDLIFGAARMGLRIVEVPIIYHERTYGTTNISRWRHGALLIAMLAFAARRLKFV